MTENQGFPGRTKVLFVITKSNFGGAQRYVYDLATGLPRDDFDVAVVFGGTGESGGAAGTLSHMLAEAGIRTIHVPELGRDISMFKDWASLRVLIRLFRAERPDVVHLNSSKAGGLGVVAGRIAGIHRIVFTAHGWPFWEPRNPLSRALIWCASYLTILLSHRTICISHYDAEAMRRKPFVEKKVQIVFNGILDAALFDRDTSRTRLFSPAEISAHATDTWVVSIGELTTNKNYQAALAAIARHNATADRKIFYCIIGTGENRTHIEQYISERSLDTHVKLLGYIENARTYLKGFDILFLPSYKEGVPYVILEAGLAEVPVIASRVGGIPEVITDNVSGILRTADDVAGFAEALGQLAVNADARRTYANTLYTKVVHNHSLAKMIANTMAVYRD